MFGREVLAAGISKEKELSPKARTLKEQEDFQYFWQVVHTKATRSGFAFWQKLEFAELGGKDVALGKSEMPRKFLAHTLSDNRS